MPDPDSIETSSEDIDLLHAGESVASDSPPVITESASETPAAQTPGPDLVGETEIKNLMVHFNPGILKDVAQAEKGVENFFLFQDSPLALASVSRLKNLTEKDIKWLEEINAAVVHSYLTLTESGSLTAEKVLIRPPTLRRDQVARILRSSDLFSAASLARFLYAQEKKSAILEQSGELGQEVSRRFLAHRGAANLPGANENEKIIPGLRLLSVEYLLDTLDPEERFSISVISNLSRTCQEVQQSIGHLLNDEIRLSFEPRKDKPFLYELAADFHIPGNSYSGLVEINKGEVKVNRSEMEWIFQLFTQIARKVLVALLPYEESAWVEEKGPPNEERYLQELKNHPSFAGRWPDAQMFLTVYENLMKRCRALQAVRRDVLAEIVAQEALKPLDMRFEPYFFDMANLPASQKAVEMYGGRDSLYDTVKRKIEANREVLHFHEKRQTAEKKGLYLLFLANLAGAFVRNKSYRTFLHQMAKFNGYERGIYSMLREVKEGVDSPQAVDEQIKLARAIREWEDLIEKEKRKQNRTVVSFIAGIIAFFLGLFGGKKNRREEDESSRKGGPLKKSKVIVGPKERKLRIPSQVQKAVDKVEEDNKGIIWLDQVLRAMDTVRFNEDAVGDMLFYDTDSRYTEVRQLIKLRRVFLRKELESNPEWRNQTVDYLDTVRRAVPPSKREPYEALLTYLKYLT